MRQQTLVLAVLGAALMVTAGVVGGLTLGAGNAAAASANGDKSVTVSTSGEIEAAADQAIVRVAVTATGNDSNAVRQEIAADVESLRAALQEYGLSSADIRTAYYDISQVRERTPEGMEAGEYRGTHAFELTVNNTSAAGEVIDVAVSNGADQVDGVSFTLSDEKRSQLYNEALTKAMGNARTQAETLAMAGDISITGVHTIVSSETHYRPYALETAAMTSAAGDSASTSVQPGPVMVTASVQVTYNATSA
ncbi:SIMPL domain-containing protein [Halobacterium zhouii]|uniref:SIMPL domain-containing protein n=1 Tax=Halobacterium zhouii TaxID=2902624 RepID=UPI001E59E81E|nr:SIMPL domain-containing protein [Halobacterium zhouii]